MLQHREALWRAEYVCAREQRPYSKSDQPARQSEGGFLDWPRASGQRGGMVRAREQAIRELVAALAQLGSESIRGEKAGARQTGHDRDPAVGRSPWPVCDGGIIEDRLTRCGRTDFAGRHSPG